jgi:tetratricopeptide (TPR) repeat protein
VPVDDAFSQAFDISYRELDVEVYQYLSKWALTGLAFRLGEGGVQFPEVAYQNNSIAKQDAMEILFEKLTMLSEGFLGDGEHKALFAGMERFYPGLADRVMEKLLSEEPENLSVIMRTAMIYHNVERYDEVFELYEKALDIDASDPGVLNNFAWFLATVPDMTLRDPQRAIPFAEKAVESKKLPQYMDTLAEAYYAAGSFQKAVEIINEAIALEPEYEYLKEQLEKFTGALEEV